VNTSADVIAGALDLHVLRRVSLYDALIVQAAVVGGCQRVLSEDIQHGATFAGVRIENPFAGL
jgi:predicted nucleic acid-binding protein